MIQDDHKTFHVGINVVAIRDGKILLGLRKNVFGAGLWGLPGGHLEHGESMEEVALRELEEETGLKADKLEFLNLVNDRLSDQHRLQVSFVVENIQGDPENLEPERFERWEWFPLGSIPEEMLPGHFAHIKLITQNQQYGEEID